MQFDAYSTIDILGRRKGRESSAGAKRWGHSQTGQLSDDKVLLHSGKHPASLNPSHSEE